MTDIIPVNTRVAIWTEICEMFGLPYFGVVVRYLPDYPGGPTYEIEFAEGDIERSCLKPDWLFPVVERTRMAHD